MRQPAYEPWNASYGPYLYPRRRGVLSKQWLSQLTEDCGGCVSPCVRVGRGSRARSQRTGPNSGRLWHPKSRRHCLSEQEGYQTASFPPERPLVELPHTCRCAGARCGRTQRTPRQPWWQRPAPRRPSATCWLRPSCWATGSHAAASATGTGRSVRRGRNRSSGTCTTSQVRCDALCGASCWSWSGSRPTPLLSLQEWPCLRSMLSTPITRPAFTECACGYTTDCHTVIAMLQTPTRS